MAVYKDKERNTWYYEGSYKDFIGNNKRYKKRGFKTKKEAKEAESKLLIYNRDNGSNMIIDELYEEFIQYSYGRKKETTINKDKQMYQLHIQEYFGHKKYKDISVKDIVRWQNELKNIKLLSPVNINSIMKSFNKYFTYVAKVYLHQYNPVSLAGRLKEPKRKYVIWNEQDFSKFMSTLDDVKYRTAFRLLYFTGIRRGEFLALLWSDYDGSKSVYQKLAPISKEDLQ